MTAYNSRETGNKKEALAAEYLSLQGIKIIANNYRCRQGEIDLIGLDRNYLVFFEIKYRKSTEYGNPIEAVGSSKQKKICKTALYFLTKNPQYNSCGIRFDVIGIKGNEIEWIQNAFDYMA